MNINANFRLQESLSFLIKASESYHDKVEFIININACIQALRNVTFVLQKQKSDILNFDKWYFDSWQTAIKKDPIMKWVHDSRNVIVKESNLKTYSCMSISIHEKYYESAKIILEVDPFLGNHEIADYLYQTKPEYIAFDGYLKIERMWIEDKCNGIELLRILTHCYIILEQLIKDVIEQIGPSKIYPDTILSKASITFNDSLLITDNKIPDKINDFQKIRVTWYKLPEFENVELKNLIIERDETFKVQLEQRYGKIIEIPKTFKSLQDKVDHHVMNAKKIFRIDKFHLNSLFLFDRDDNLTIMNMIFQGITDKYLSWNNVYEFIKKNMITEIIYISEIWIAALTEETKNVNSLSELSEKQEALMVIGCNYNNEFISNITPFIRANDEILFLKEHISHDCNANYIFPIFDIWKRWKDVGLL